MIDKSNAAERSSSSAMQSLPRRLRTPRFLGMNHYYCYCETRAQWKQPQPENMAKFKCERPARTTMTNTCFLLIHSIVRPNRNKYHICIFICLRFSLSKNCIVCVSFLKNQTSQRAADTFAREIPSQPLSKSAASENTGGCLLSGALQSKGCIQLCTMDRR